MSFTRLLAPLLAAAILVIAALVGAGAANAHPGHAHTGTAAAPAASEVSAPLGEAAIAMALAVGAADVVAPPALSKVDSSGTRPFEVAIEAGHGAPDAPCRGVCCDNTPCGGCVKMAFGKTALPAPSLGTWVRTSVEARKLAGRLAEGPNEPPRSFI